MKDRIFGNPGGIHRGIAAPCIKLRGMHLLLRFKILYKKAPVLYEYSFRIKIPGSHTAAVDCFFFPYTEKSIGFNALPAQRHRESAMPNEVTLVVATHNVDKASELTDFLKDFPVILKSLGDFGPIPSFQENGRTFEENAYHKASFTARILGLPALADDSGLVVEALDGAPGVYSARYAGEHAVDNERCAKVLQKMKGKTNRKARFECVLSIAVPTGCALTYESKVDGYITEAPVGSNGFGYDPIFYYPSLDKTFAQLTRDEKNAVSHRGKALMELRNEFDKVLIWIDQHMPVFEKTGFKHGDPKL